MSVDKFAKIIWDYMQMNHRMERSDCIIVFGSQDARIAERAAELFLQGFAPYVVFSGCFYAVKTGTEKNQKARTLVEATISMGIPENRIIIESSSKSFVENVHLIRTLLAERGITPKSAIAVHQPYTERRAFVTFQKVWPELKIRVTSPKLSYETYLKAEKSKEQTINIMLEDLLRVITYPHKGYSIPQIIPRCVQEAYTSLVDLGFDCNFADEVCYNNYVL